MLGRSMVFAACAAYVAAQSSSLVLSGTNTADLGDLNATPTGSYNSYTATVSLSQSSNGLTFITGASGTGSATSVLRNVTITTNGTTFVTASPTATYLTASRSNNTASMSSTSSAAAPTNTQPCNGWAEFCDRSYGNVSMVGAHNSPFDIAGNIASNQMLGVTNQLNDGIRMLQFQTHKPNASSPIMLCHTSCDLLNAGPLVDYLTTVREWLDQNPYEVVTVLMGNDDVLAPGNYTDPVYNSGINRYLYTPPTVPMSLDDWPTLGEMILNNHRVVMMLDYEANQEEIPWLLDEFANMWETPFSPTDRDFPCTEDRPPNQDRNISSNRLYMANHNLNVDIQLLGTSLLAPATTLANETNAVSGYGSAGAMEANCTRDWNRPPNFMLVDFYNIGNFNGSVFQVAADANGVSYNRDSCCGLAERRSSSATTLSASHSALLLMIGLACFLW